MCDIYMTYNHIGPADIYIYTLTYTHGRVRDARTRARRCMNIGAIQKNEN